MEISLTPNVERLLRLKIAEGLYDSLEEAINGTLSIALTGKYFSQEKIDELKAEIQKGIDDYDAGRYSEGLDFMDEIIAEYE